MQRLKGRHRFGVASGPSHAHAFEPPRFGFATRLGYSRPDLQAHRAEAGVVDFLLFGSNYSIAGAPDNATLTNVTVEYTGTGLATSAVQRSLIQLQIESSFIPGSGMPQSVNLDGDPSTDTQEPETYAVSTTVPEPSTVMICGLASMGLLGAADERGHCRTRGCIAGRSVDKRQSFANGKFGEFRDSVDLEFVHDLPALGLNGLDAYVENGRNFLARLSLGQKLKYFPLSSRQDRQRAGSHAQFVTQVLFNDRTGHRRA